MALNHFTGFELDLVLLGRAAKWQDHLMAAAMWRLTRCIDGRTFLQPQKEVKDQNHQNHRNQWARIRSDGNLPSSRANSEGFIFLAGASVWHCVVLLHVDHD